MVFKNTGLVLVWLVGCGLLRSRCVAQGLAREACPTSVSGPSTSEVSSEKSMGRCTELPGVSFAKIDSVVSGVRSRAHPPTCTTRASGGSTRRSQPGSAARSRTDPPRSGCRRAWLREGRPRAAALCPFTEAEEEAPRHRPPPWQGGWDYAPSGRANRSNAAPHPLVVPAGIRRRAKGSRQSSAAGSAPFD